MRVLLTFKVDKIIRLKNKIIFPVTFHHKEGNPNLIHHYSVVFPLLPIEELPPKSCIIDVKVQSLFLRTSPKRQCYIEAIMKSWRLSTKANGNTPLPKICIKAMGRTSELIENSEFYEVPLHHIFRNNTIASCHAGLYKKAKRTDGKGWEFDKKTLSQEPNVFVQRDVGFIVHPVSNGPNEGKFEIIAC